MIVLITIPIVLLLLILYPLIVSFHIFYNLKNYGIETRYIKFMGHSHALYCTWFSQQFLYYSLLYDIVMYYLAHQQKKHIPSNLENECGCCIGDSEFALWNTLVDDFSKTEVFNAGFGGATSLHLLKHASMLCFDYNPSFIILHIGGNDYDLYHNQIFDYTLENISTFCAQATCPVYFLKTPRKPGYTDDKWSFLVKLAHTSQKLKNCHVLDITTDTHPEMYFTDGLHMKHIPHKKQAKTIQLKIVTMNRIFVQTQMPHSQ